MPLVPTDREPPAAKNKRRRRCELAAPPKRFQRFYKSNKRKGILAHRNRQVLMKYLVHFRINPSGNLMKQRGRGVGLPRGDAGLHTSRAKRESREERHHAELRRGRRRAPAQRRQQCPGDDAAEGHPLIDAQPGNHRRLRFPAKGFFDGQEEWICSRCGGLRAATHRRLPDAAASAKLKG